MIDIIMLGTTAQFPTKYRNHSSFFLRFKTFKALFDCGEGTQRQMRIAKLSPHNIDSIFISHWHGDHTLGLGGVIQSMNATQRTNPLTIYGPDGTKQRVKNILGTYYFKKNFLIKIVELSPEKLKKFSDNKEFTVSCFPASHGIPTIGFVFETKPVRKININYTEKFGLVQHPLLGKLQKGKDIVYQGKKISVKKATFLKHGIKISYIPDTKNFEKLSSYVKNSDMLVCEATYSQKDKELCSDYNHLSNVEAARIAKKSKSKKLIITHISQRYKKINDLESEAKKIFKNTVYAKDFDHYTL